MILSSHRKWLATVAELDESDLPCNVSTVAYAITVARAAVEAHDRLIEVVDQLVPYIAAASEVAQNGCETDRVLVRATVTGSEMS